VDVRDKLAILADAAKYDASCASSGAKRAGTKTGLGSSTGNGICHRYTPDGRCISLLKILLTNKCTFDCTYCVNRRSSDVPRPTFSVNIELPTQVDLATLAPEKRLPVIQHSMSTINDHHAERPEHFAPAGQSTQVIIERFRRPTRRSSRRLRSSTATTNFAASTTPDIHRRSVRIRDSRSTRRPSFASIAYTKPTGSFGITSFASTS
jgi:predicted DNA-binding helix-hairpin-helix protein